MTVALSPHLVKKAAYLASTGCSQKRIAALLDTSQATVSRLLAAARRRNWLVTECRLSAEDRHRIARELFKEGDELLHSLQALSPGPDVPLRYLSIIPLDSAKATAVPGKHQLAAFGKNVAPQILKQFREMRDVGVAWGKTVASVVAALAQQNPSLPNRNRAPVVFFPLCGEPMDFAVSRFSSSVSASRLHEFFSGERESTISLGPIPARIPRGFSSTEQAVIRRFIEHSKAYTAVFRNEDCLANRMDSMITSGGTFESRSYDDLWLRDTARAEGLSSAQLAKYTIGDIGGAFVPRAGLTRRQSERFEEIAARWTGVTLEQIRNCAMRASSTNAPGVIFIAAGSAKVDIVHESIKEGLINRLYIDPSLASALLRRLSVVVHRP